MIAPPPRNQRFFLTNVSRLLDLSKDAVVQTKKVSIYFPVGKSLSIDDVGVSRGTPHFRRYDRELVFETGDSIKETLGGATVVGLGQAERSASRSNEVQSHPTVRGGVQHQSLTSSHEELNISHPILHDFEGIRSHNQTTKASMALVS